MLVIKQLLVPINFHSISFPTMEVNLNQQLFGSLKLFKILHIFFNVRKKLVQVGTTWKVSFLGERKINFIFWLLQSELSL